MAFSSRNIGILLPYCILTELLLLTNGKEKIVFTFPEFPYKDTSKNEMTFHEFESACEQTGVCRQLDGVSRVRCVRECVSPSCYRDIYSPDPLEEGEIDVIKLIQRMFRTTIQQTKNMNE